MASGVPCGRQLLWALLAATAPLALVAGGVVALAVGRPLGWAAVALGAAAVIGLAGALRRRPATAAGRFDDRALIDLVDQLPFVVWLEDWRPVRRMLAAAREQAGGDVGGWLDGHPEQRAAATVEARIVHANPAAHRLYGVTSRDDFLDPQFDTMVTREPGATVAGLLLPLLDGETRAVVFDSLDQRGVDGSRFSVRTALVVPQGCETDWRRVIMVETEITEEVEANRALAASEQRFRRLLDQLPTAVWLEDWSAVRPLVLRAVEEGGGDLADWLARHPAELAGLEDEMRVLYVNDAACRLYRAASVDELRRTGTDRLLTPERAEEIALRMRVMVDGAREVPFEIGGVRRVDGSTMYLRGVVVVMPGHEGDWSQVLVVENDATEEARTARELAESERRYRELFEQSPLAIWENDWSRIRSYLDGLRASGVSDLREHLRRHPGLASELTGEIVYTDVNLAGARLYDVPDREALLSGEHSLGFSRDESEATLDMALALYEGERRVTRDARSMTFNGERIDVRITASAHEAHVDDWTRIVLIIEDITAQQAVQQRIAASERRHRELFEQSPLAIWENDWSGVKRVVDALRVDGVTELRPYLEARPELVHELYDLVGVRAINAATLDMYGISDPDGLLDGSLKVPAGDDELVAFVDVLCAFAGGDYRLSRDIVEATFDGRSIVTRNAFTMPETHRESWDQVVIFAEDITQQREALVRLEQSERNYRELFEQSPFAIWESDWTAVKQLIDEQGIDDIGAFLRSRPALAAEINSRIRAVDMNAAAIRLFGITSPEKVKAGEEAVTPTRDEIDALIEMAEGFQRGDAVVVRDIVEETFDHRVVIIRATSMIPEGARDTWSRMVSVIDDITEQQEARARIESSERRYRELFDQAPIGIRVDDWSHLKRRVERLFVSCGGRLADHLIAHRDELRALCDDMRIVEANEGCLRIYGLADLDALRSHVATEIADDMLDELARTLEQLVQGAASVRRGETEEPTEAGTIFTRGSVLIPDEYARDWARVILTVEDVTEIRRTREALESSERRYRELFDQSPVSVWVEDWSRVKPRVERIYAEHGDAAEAYLSEHGEVLAELYDLMVLVDINEMGWRQRHAASREDILAWSRLSGPQDQLDVCLTIIKGLMRGERRIALKDSHQARFDGTTFVERGVTFVPPEFADDWRRVIHVIDDVTAEHEALRDLNESRRMMALAQRMSRHGHFVYDADVGRIIAASDTIGQMLGIAPERFLTTQGESFDFVHPDDRERVASHLRDTAQRGEAADIEFRVLWPNGEVRHLHEQSEFLLDEQGRRLNRRIGTIHDVTEERRTAEALRRARDDAERASRAKTEFLATISHELRTPLNAIIGFSEVMLEGMFGPLENPRYNEYVHDINESGRHLLDLINDILDLAKAEAGRLQLHDDIASLTSVLEQSAKLFRERADRSGVALHVAVAPDMPLLRADTRKLRQVLLNLISNAVKFTPEHGRIDVTARLNDQDGIDVIVADTGIGMTAEDMARAFEVFGQVDSALNRRYEGTGLGLPLSRAVMKLHRGELLMESTPGRGTRVTARFPPERTHREKRRRDAGTTTR